jgi:SAM-dependent methyltransferase
MTDLATIGQGWDRAAREDAFFNILTIPGKEGGRWTADEFFEHGRQEIDYVIERLNRLGFRDSRHRTAVDFGCGVGRLTQALANHYEVAFGVDASGEMIAQADKWAGEFDMAHRCVFFHNEEPDLRFVKAGTADIIYSMITLQHMPNELQKAYVQEFMRIISDDGVAVFEVPEGPDYEHPNSWLSMYGVDPQDVRDWVRGAGGEVVDIELTGASTDVYSGWRYTARRK